MPDQRRPAQLTVHQNDQGVRTIPLLGEGYRIGRDTALEICIDHSAVSRRHALLERRGRHWLIRDLDSTNGLWWRGRRIQELELQDGDCVSLAPDSTDDPPSLSFRFDSQRLGLRVKRVLGYGLLSGLGGAVLVLAMAALQVPVRGRLASVRGPLAIYDGNNQPLNSVDSSRHRELDQLDAFAPVLVDALLSSEDNRFWWHPGVDPIGTLRAFSANLTGGRVLEGGSSLTQQLARSLYPELVGEGDTLGRKWRELLVALQLESRFSKGELLLSYLNRVYLGVGWGFDDAARTYFDRSAGDLNIEQAALLVGLLPSPNGHDPCVSPQRALEARNRVINKMADAGRLSLDQARTARRQPIQLASGACSGTAAGRDAPSTPIKCAGISRHWWVRRWPLKAIFSETHLDPVLQSVLERQLRNLLSTTKDLGISEGAAVVIDSRSGGVLAIAGGRDYKFSQFNRASMALRQPGSTFKLMTYLAALEAGIQPTDTIDCSPLTWRGQRFDSTCKGRLSLTRAFATSNNPAALRLAQRVGLDQVVRQAKALGITSPLDPVPGLALGQSEVRLLELTGAYAAVVNEGEWRSPSTIRRLMDGETCREESLRGCRNLDRANHRGRQAISQNSAQQMQSLLRAVVQNGTGRAAFLGGQEGGKTGTTNDGRDLLFVGFEPKRQWVLGIWLGNDDNSPSAGSSALAASLWADIIRAAGRGGLNGA